MIDLRKTLLATGFLALAACGGEPAGTTTPALPALDTIEVTAASNGAGSRWDGVVEAVLVKIGDKVAMPFLQSLVAYPPSQKPGSFNLNAVKSMIEQAAARK